MPLSPMRQQFAAPGPQIPGQAVLGAIGPQGPTQPQGLGVGGPMGMGIGGPQAQPQMPQANPQHEALKRMLGMV